MSESRFTAAPHAGAAVFRTGTVIALNATPGSPSVTSRRYGARRAVSPRARQRGDAEKTSSIPPARPPPRITASAMSVGFTRTTSAAPRAFPHEA